MGLHLPKIRFDSHTLGNLVKNVAPVAGTLVGGPLGLAVGGGLGALGELGRGKNIGEAAKAGLSNAAITGVGQAAGSALGYHGGIGSLGGNAGGLSGHAAGVPQVSSAGSGFGGGTTTVGQGIDGSYSAASAPGVPETGTLGKIGSGIGKVGGWVGDHDKTSAAVLGGLGNLGTAGSQNRLLNAQADIAAQTAQQNAYEQKRREASDLALEPLRQALYGKIGSNLGFSGVPS